MSNGTRAILVQPRQRSDAEVKREIAIRTYRRDRRLTQQEMADRLGIARSYLAAIESGHNPITDDIARKISPLTKQKIAVVVDEWRRKFGKRKVAK